MNMTMNMRTAVESKLKIMHEENENDLTEYLLESLSNYFLTHRVLIVLLL